MAELEGELGEIADIAIATEVKKIVSGDKDQFRSEVNAGDFSEEIMKSFYNRSGTVGTKQYDAKVQPYDVLDCAPPPYNMAYLTQLYEISPIHAAAVDARVDNVVGLGWYFDYTEKTKRDREAVAADEEERIKFDRVLAKEKARLTTMLEDMAGGDEIEEVLNAVVKDAYTTGNGYFEIGRTVEGKIAYLGHIPARDVRVRRRKDGYVQYVDGNPIFFRNFGDLTKSDPFKQDRNPNELIHYKVYSPTNQYYGVPEVVSVVDAVAGIQYATKYNLEYFENKAVPRYIIKLKNVKINTEQQSKLMKFFETTTKSVSHRSLMVPIVGNKESDISFEAVETGKQEASFGEYIEMNMMLILARHRIAKGYLGISDGAGLSASRDSDKIFKDSVTGPQQRILEKKLTRPIKELSDRFVFKLAEYSLTDEKTQSEIDERYLRMGVFLPDEVRSQLGYSRRPDGHGDDPMDARALAILGAKTAASKQTYEQTNRGNRARDRERAANNPDSPHSATGRNPKGEGRIQE